jgi:hypothetical protein
MNIIFIVYSDALYSRLAWYLSWSYTFSILLGGNLTRYWGFYFKIYYLLSMQPGRILAWHGGKEFAARDCCLRPCSLCVEHTFSNQISSQRHIEGSSCSTTRLLWWTIFGLWGVISAIYARFHGLTRIYMHARGLLQDYDLMWFYLIYRYCFYPR